MKTIISKDTLWKGIIEDLFEEFVWFFFPQDAPKVDWEKPCIPLEKELSQLHPENQSPKRLADKLFQVFLRDGGEQWILIHIEAQGYRDKEMPKRMFQTFYRLMDRFQKPITSLVIYTNAEKSYHFRAYQYRFWGTELSYRFKSFSCKHTAIWGLPCLPPRHSFLKRFPIVG